jgi:hypothetical protein
VGKIFVEYAESSQTKAAAQSLQGRRFAGRIVQVGREGGREAGGREGSCSMVSEGPGFYLFIFISHQRPRSTTKKNLNGKSWRETIVERSGSKARDRAGGRERGREGGKEEEAMEGENEERQEETGQDAKGEEGRREGGREGGRAGKEGGREGSFRATGKQSEYL